MDNGAKELSEFFNKSKCSNCTRRAKPRKKSACYMEQDNPNHIPINDYIKNGTEFYCADFKER
jgi:hypothetical protein